MEIKNESVEIFVPHWGNFIAFHPTVHECMGKFGKRKSMVKGEKPTVHSIFLSGGLGSHWGF